LEIDTTNDSSKEEIKILKQGEESESDGEEIKLKLNITPRKIEKSIPKEKERSLDNSIEEATSIPIPSVKRLPLDLPLKETKSMVQYDYSKEFDI